MSRTPDLRGHDDQTVVGDPVAGGAESVAVEDGADDRPVGEGDRRRTVPRLHDRGVELVEGPLGRVHVPVLLPGLGDHHQHRVGSERPPRWSSSSTSSKLAESLAPGRDDREDPLQVAREQVAGQQILAGPHPVAVALQGVDLPVVGEVAVRVGEGPAREGVGREAGVHQGQRALEALVAQIREKDVHLWRREHPFVDHGTRREGGEVGVGQARVQSACAR